MSTVVAQLGQYGNQFGPVLFKTLFKQGLSDTRHANDMMRYFRVREEKGGGDEANSALTFIPRAVLVDTEPKAVEAALSGLRNKRREDGHILTYDKSNSHTLQGGAGNNWALGHNTLAPILVPGTVELLRRETERCDRLDSLLVLSSLAGGTGSGVGSALAQHLRDEYRGTQLVVQTVLPMANEVLTQDVNAVLSLGALYGVAPVLLASNDELRGVYSRRVFSSPSTRASRLPSFEEINKTLALQLSASIRGESLSTLIDKSVDSYIRKCLLIRRCPPLSSSGSALTTHGLLASVQRMVATGHYDDEGFPHKTYRVFKGCVTFRGIEEENNCMATLTSEYGGRLSTVVKQGESLEAGIILNSAAISANLGMLRESLLKKLSVNAYVHHYDRQGTPKEEIINSLRAVAQMESDYKEKM